VTPLSNYYFMAVSAVLLTAVGVFVTQRVVEPRLGAYAPDEDEGAPGESSADDAENGAGKDRASQDGDGEDAPHTRGVTAVQTRALRKAGLAGLLYVVAVVAATLPVSSPLRGENGALLESPLLDGIVPLILFFFVTVASVYGRAVGALRSTSDVPRLMAESVKDLSGFLVLVFAAAQAIAWFDWTRLGLWVAVNGADLLESMGVSGILGLVGFSLLTVVLSMLIASGSALWAVEAPVFVPMFMLNGVNPAYVQVAYRIADSSTNSIVPMSPYLAVMLGFMQEYDRKAGLGTLFALMIPYTVAFYGSWLLLFVAWALLGLPVGPGETMDLPR
jgi:aminobenzoyl-glutamate transport protein